MTLTRKNIYQIRTVSIFNGELFRMISIKVGITIQNSTISSILLILELLDNKVRQDKAIRDIRIKKKRKLEKIQENLP